MSFFMGLAGGIAEGATRTINTILDKREEEASAARKYMQQRNIQKSEKYESDKVEMESLMKGFAELTGGDLDKAAQLIKGSGNIERASARLELLSSERLKNADFDINKTFEFAQAQTGSGDPYVIGDYVESLVKRPELSQAKTSEKFGLGLADKFLPEAEKIALAGPSGRTIDIGAARMMPGATTVAEEYQRETEKEEVTLKNAILTNRKLEAEIEDMGKMDGGDFAGAFDDVLKSAMTARGHAYDATTGRFTLKDAEDAYDTAFTAHTETLQSTVKRAVETNAITKPDVKNAMFTAANQVASYLTEAGGSKYAPKPFDPNKGNDEVGMIYRADWNSDGTIGDALYLGNDNFILLN